MVNFLDLVFSTKIKHYQFVAISFSNLEKKKKLCLLSLFLSLVKKIQEALEEMNAWETVVSRT